MNVRAFPTLKQSFRTRSEFIPSSTRKSLRNRSLCSTGKLASFKRILNLAMNYSRGRQSTLSKVVKLTCSYQQICLRLHEIFKSFPVVAQPFPLLSRQIPAVERFDASLSRLVQQMFTFDFFIDFPHMHWPSKLLTTNFPFLREAARVFRESKISNEKSIFFLFYQNIPFCELVSKKIFLSSSDFFFRLKFKKV